MIVKNVTTEDQGEYTCNAKNGKGDASWSANLYFNKTIISKSTEISLVANSYLEKLNGINTKLKFLLDLLIKKYLLVSVVTY